MVDTASFYHKGIPSRTYEWRDEEEDALEIIVPPYRPRSYTRTVRLGHIIQVMDAKRARRALLSEEVTDDGSEASIEQMKVWAQIGYVVIFGIVISIIGTVLRFIFSGPLPFALAALGMLFVIMALWQGRKLQSRAA